MADYGHEWTDKRLDLMEKRIAKIYSETVEDAKKRLGEILATFEKEGKERAALVESGKMKQRNYIAWRQETLGKAKHLQDMIGVLTEDFTNADKIAIKIVSGEAMDVYALNANFAAYDIERNTNMNLSWTLYDHSTVERLIKDTPDLLPLPSVDIPMDKRWNQQHITAAITKGILLGDPIPEIAKRLQSVANMGYNAAVRSARTATTAAECAGRTDAYKRAEKMGIQLKQQWVATLDGKTRHAHRRLDGQTVDVGQPFTVDGYELDYPGDPKAPGYLIYNCRCTIISVDKFHDPNAPRASKLGDVSYEEWKAGREVADGNRWGTYSKSSENVQKSVDNQRNSGIIKLNKAQSTALNSRADPMADAFGSGEKSHPDKIQSFRKELLESNVSIVEHEKENLGYCPGLRRGEPGTIYISKGASYSAWAHEMQHMRDDRESGWLGMRVIADPDKRLEWEIRAYDVEIKMALDANRPDIAEMLRKNLDEERRKIYGEQLD